MTKTAKQEDLHVGQKITFKAGSGRGKGTVEAIDGDSISIRTRSESLIRRSRDLCAPLAEEEVTEGEPSQEDAA